jgi:hypothetical protein
MDGMRRLPHKGTFTQRSAAEVEPVGSIFYRHGTVKIASGAEMV